MLIKPNNQVIQVPTVFDVTSFNNLPQLVTQSSLTAQLLPARPLSLTIPTTTFYRASWTLVTTAQNLALSKATAINRQARTHG